MAKTDRIAGPMRPHNQMILRLMRRSSITCESVPAQDRCAPAMIATLRNSRLMTSPAKWAVVAVLAWAQAASAAHQFEHSLDEPGEVCEVCLYLGSSDDSLVDAGVSVSILHSAYEVLVDPQPLALAARFPNYNTRASP